MKSFIFFLFISLNSFALQVEVSDEVIGNTHPLYLSYAIDTAQIVGGKWWDDNGQSNQAPLDLKHPSLVQWTKELGPAFLRIGGSEADKVFIDFKDEYQRPPKNFKSLLKAKQWSDLQTFLKATQHKLFFTINAGPGVRKKGNWQNTEFQKLLDHIEERKDPMPIFELGNEVNAFWIFYGPFKHVFPKQYAKDYVMAREYLRSYSDLPLAGPSYAIWPILGEPLGFLFGSMRSILKRTPNMDILSWHFYPTQTKRCGVAVRSSKFKNFLKPKVLDEVQKVAKKLIKWKKKYNPDTEIWMSETGPAQCGGQKGLNDRFINSFWWLDQLGTLAKLEHKVVIRQTLIGSDYGMIRFPKLERTPDYWASMLWKKYMGQKVLKVNHKNKFLRIYAHCSPIGGTSVLAINLQNQKSLLEFPFEIKEKSILSAPSLLSKEIYINQELSGKKMTKKAKGKKLNLNAYEMAFIRLPELNKDLCTL